MSDTLFPDFATVFAPDDAAPTKPIPSGATRNVSEADLVAGLNGPQREAVIHAGAPVLVVADASKAPSSSASAQVCALLKCISGVRMSKA